MVFSLLKLEGSTVQFDIMDHTGHTIEAFDTADPAMLEAAEARFNALVKDHARVAAVKTGPAQSRVVRKFDPTATGVLFIPRFVGG